MEALATLKPSPIGMPGVETWIIEPPGLGVALRISIARPVQPAVGGDSDANVAVVYATDADYLFGTVAEGARVGSFGGDMAPAVVVGIGYADETGDLSFVTKRRFLAFYRGPRRGFDAGAYGSFEFGGADAFLAALKDHVIPAVEKHVVNIDPGRRILLGTSAGGHFATYVLSRDPGLFQGYALMSPMLVDPQAHENGILPRQQGDGSMVQLVESLPDDALPAECRVFLSAGELEEEPLSMFADFNINSNAMRLRAVLARRGVDTQYFSVPGETHGSATAAASRRALRFLLSPQTAKQDWREALAAKPDATP